MLTITNIDEPPAFLSSRHIDRVALVGVPRKITLVAASDPEGAVTYSIPNKPSWISQTGRVLDVNAENADRGLHTITLVATDTGTNTANLALTLEVIAEPSLAKWKLPAGKPRFEIATEVCAHMKKFRSGHGITHFEIGINYNNEGEQSNTLGRTLCASSSPLMLMQAVGSGGSNAQVSYVASDSNIVVGIDSVLGMGRHAYKVKYSFRERFYVGTVPRTEAFYSKLFNLTYDLSAVTITVAEVEGTGSAAAGHKLGTLTLDNAVANAQWSLVGTPQEDVGLAAVSGSGTTEGALSLTSPTVLDFEAGAGFVTITVEAVTPDTEASLEQAIVEVVILLSDVNEPPVFASELPDQRVSGVTGGTFTFPQAIDPENTGVAVTYSASLADTSNTPLPTGGVSFNTSSRVFTVASGSTEATLTIKVVAEDTTGVTAEQLFELQITKEGINASASGSLTRQTRTVVLPVRLDDAPSGGNVTVTLTSANAGQVAVAPAHMVFTPGNWSQVQNANVSLTDAGLEVKGSRSIDVNLAVHDASNSASNYRSVPAVSVAIAVNVVNAAPTFAASQRSRNIDENTGAATTAAGTAIGAPITAEDEDNQNAGDLTYSLVGTSSVFGVFAGTGQITLLAATNLDYETTSEYMLTLKVEDDEAVAIRGRATVTVAIGINPVNEPPVLGALLDQTVIEEVGGSYQFDPAVDPDAGDDLNLTYSATQANGSARPEGVGFNAASRTFTFAASLTAQTVTLRVTASDGSLTSQPRDFVLRVRSGGAIVANTSGLAALSRTTRQASFGVRLDVQPQAKGVTLTLESLDANEVVVAPVTMEFDRSNWNVEQSATVSFTDAGAMVKGSREVSLSLGVYDQSSSDGYFQGSAAQTVAVQIENANAAPAFDLAAIGAIELTLDENSGQLRQASATDVGTPITATDEDNDNASLTYTLVGAGSQFRIGASDGQLAAAAGVNFNHERQSSYELTVQAADGETAAPGLVPGIARVTVTVLLNDVAEKPNDYTGHGFAVSGRTRNDLTLGWSNAEYEAQFDEFDRASIVVSYGGGGYAGRQSLSADATQARLAGLVPGVEYAITLHWYSADALAQDTAVVQSSVMVQANDAPVFAGSLVYSRSENIGSATTPAGIGIVAVAATDAQSDAISYSIRGGDDAALFAIDARTGMVSLVRALNFDHESKDSYTFMVAATDLYGATTTGALVLNITDVNEDPVLPQQFAQTAVAGMESTITLRTATDPEAGDIVYEGEMEDGSGLPTWMNLNSMSGELTISSPTDADAGTYRVRVRALVVVPGSSRIAAAAGPVAFNEPQVASERVFVLVVVASGSTNNLPSFASADTSFNLDENSQFAAGTSVGMVVATDADSGDSLSYSLRGEDAQPFAIGSGGELMLGRAETFDRESKQVYRFVVDVDDGAGGLASTEVEIMIDNVNEAPEFLVAAEVHRVVGRRSSSFFASPAFDPDEGDTLTYTASRLAGGWLTFDASSLMFTATANAILGMHSVTVTATDVSGLSAEQVLTVDVQTAGNRVPAFASAVAPFELMLEGEDEMLVSGSEIGTVAAVDADSHQLTYRIVPGADAPLFRIDSESGLISAAVDIVPGTYRFVVEADDGNGGTSRLVVELAVQPAVPAGTDKEDEVGLMVIDRSIASAAADIIRRRLDAPASAAAGGAGSDEGEDEPMHMRMASAEDQWNDWRYDHESDADRIERMQLRDYLYSRGFDFALAGSGSQGQQMRMWGSGSRTSLDGYPEVGGEQVSYDGDTNLFMLGFEASLADTRFGLAAGRSKAKLAFANSDERAERQLGSIHPYLSFQASEHIRLWASGGFGKGDFVRIDSSDEKTSRNASYVSAAGGFEGSWEYRSLELSTGFNVLSVQSRLDALAAQSKETSQHSFWRANIDFEAGLRFNVAGEVSFRPFVGAHIRRDGGDDWLEAHEIDATAGMSLNWRQGLSAEFTSRWQGNAGRTNERNISGRINYDLGSDGRGLQLTVAPSMASSGSSEFSRTVSTRAAYGLPVRLFADSGIATVSADFSYTETSVSDSYGFRFAGRRLDVDLSAAGDAYGIELRIR